jgi:hypothetical protein
MPAVPAARSVTGLAVSLALAGQLLLASDAQAYIDPGIGSLGYQAALAALLGLGLVARHVFARLAGAAMALFGKHRGKDERANP